VNPAYSHLGDTRCSCYASAETFSACGGHSCAVNLAFLGGSTPLLPDPPGFLVSFVSIYRELSVKPSRSISVNYVRIENGEEWNETPVVILITIGTGRVEGQEGQRVADLIRRGVLCDYSLCSALMNRVSCALVVG
jgi:hypothetical protein